jgi:hypothetical protein
MARPEYALTIVQRALYEDPAHFIGNAIDMQLLPSAIRAGDQACVGWRLFSSCCREWLSSESNASSFSVSIGLTK